MQRTNFGGMACSIARAWSVIGEPWTPVILRDVMMGVGRFDVLRRDLGISRNVLADRLSTLVEAGVLEQRPYHEGRVRQEYVLTEAGQELAPILMALMQWGDRWQGKKAGPPIHLQHVACGKRLKARVTCEVCEQEVRADEVRAKKGPGFRKRAGTLVSGEYLE